MRKYFAFTRITWQQTLAYRAETMVWFVLEIISTLVMLNLWRYMFDSGKIDLAAYSELVTYYVVVLLISKLSAVHFEDWVIDSIINGDISTSFLKPFSYPVYLAFSEITWRISQVIYTIPAFLLLIPLYSTLKLPPITVTSILLFMVLMVFAYLQRFYLGWLISASAFWMEQSKSLVHFRWMCEGVFGGQWLPLSFFPIIWQTISAITPFFYWYYFPVRVLENRIAFPGLLTGFLVSLLWIIILHFVCKAFWKKALKRYSSFGH